MSRRARFLREISSWYVGLFDKGSMDIAETRKRLDTVAGLVPVASGVGVWETEIAGLHAEYLVPDGADEDRVLVYLHGGAYVLGSCASHRPVVSHLARATGVQALVPEYRLAPEHPFPAAIDDAVNVYRALLESGHDPAHIAVAGDSAGGGLAIAMTLKLRDNGEPMPACLGLLSPLLDLTGSGDSMATRKDRDPLFDPEDLPHIGRYYCDESELSNPLVSPVFADFEGMPPMLVQVGDDEILLSDSDRLAQKVRDAGGDIEVEVWSGMWHVWQMFIGLMPESREAIEKFGAYVQVRLCG